MSEKEIDIRGMVCPVPVIEITRAAKGLEVGDKLKIIMGLDGKTNVEGWARGNDFDIEDFKKEDTYIFTLVRRSGK